MSAYLEAFARINIDAFALTDGHQFERSKAFDLDILVLKKSVADKFEEFSDEAFGLRLLYLRLRSQTFGKFKRCYLLFH